MQASGAESEQRVARTNALAEARSRRVFFAHQSVGADLLDGVRNLGPASPTLVESLGVEPLAEGTWRHARLGRNGEPRTKLRQFRELLEAGLGAQVDVALFKLCYVDVDLRTDVAALHGEIAQTLEDLRRRFPRVHVVPMTVPLTAAQRGPRAWAKELLGRPVGGALENARREELNRRLRADGGPLFDLARLESEDALGRRTTVALGAQPIPVLAAQNTRDGGHLTAEASARIARRLIDFIAALP